MLKKRLKNRIQRSAKEICKNFYRDAPMTLHCQTDSPSVDAGDDWQYSALAAPGFPELG